MALSPLKRLRAAGGCPSAVGAALMNMWSFAFFRQTSLCLYQEDNPKQWIPSANMLGWRSARTAGHKQTF